jgi:DNA-binding CsgD family transcriptional regulator
VIPRLSSKQLRIAQWVSCGLKNKEIAVAEGTTEHVIKNYMRDLYNILGFSNRVEIALWCVKNDKELAAR